jgi:uncharacterized protein (DUF2141 family)
MRNVGVLLSLLVAVLALFAGGAPQAQVPQANIIHVEISGLRSDKGEVECALFTSARDFPRNGEKAVAHAKAGILHGRAACEFGDVVPGRYAVSVFHDENSNGKMDTNLMGIPREGVGASNNARGHLGPPKFDDAVFSYSGGRLELSITVAYL